MNDIIYLDNAATSWPKPPAVLQAMQTCMLEYAANPGRGSHQMAVKASRALFETRKQVAKLFGVRNPNDISFALNTTHALNQAIKGYLREGDHVICTNIEHNSVRRPLEYLRKHRGIEISYIQNDKTGELNVKDIEHAIQQNTSMVIVNHSSNLLGTIMPVGEIGELCRKKGIKLLVDAAQSAGILPIHVSDMNIDMLAFPGHKGLLGPQGTGGLYLHPDLELDVLLHGGTGSKSEDIDQPNVRPDRYEAGTQNTVGIAGLNEGIKFVLQETVEKIHARELLLTRKLMEGLMGINGLTILGPAWDQPRTGIVAFNIKETDSSELAFILDQSFKIAVRSGYHCTPLSHATAGTMATGAVRVSPGYFTTDDEVDALIAAMKEISTQYA
ncbi:cysteine desulfurase family protein [Paenibacillus eucommiae]|uniref:cysteine desulfurase n=1 Tax=Paenibacillus eucommiae TaxID=1355755 RepID=A0ABS4J441_9BACL|nr:cysteine desulfurase family protein [Paenibacillus eucommiae]